MIGAVYLGEGRCRFRVWCPAARRVAVHLLTPEDRLIPLRRAPRGYHAATAEGVAPGSLYRYRLDGGRDLPDPASRHQPEGVHGPSAVVDPAAFAWTDAGWSGVGLRDLILYELHVGTFTAGGTFAAVVPHLPRLRRLGVTAIELMPVCPFPGARNWGYDGVYPFAVQQSYGGPDGLRRLVDACHAMGLGVVLDVVYNHLGPEGNYLAEYGPYFSDAYRTPWGPALNFDGPDSDPVRRFFIESAVRWVADYRLDGLRLDAVHAILDRSARPFLGELAAGVRRAARRRGRPVAVIGESDSNDPRLIRPQSQGGLGLDAQWSDDFHHALHVQLTGERIGYYVDYQPLARLEAAYTGGYAFTGQYSRYRRRRHGSPADGCPPWRFVVCAQNHDQVGNRAAGERLTTLVPPAGARLAAAVVLLSPFIPLIFMGEEYGETAPFLFFTSHGEPALAEAVRRGRRQECAGFGWRQPAPDPQAETTFARSRIGWGPGDERRWEYFAALIDLRRQLPAGEVTVSRRDARRLLVIHRGAFAIALHFGRQPAEVEVRLGEGRWRLLLDSADARWGGPGSMLAPELRGAATRVCLGPQSCAVWRREGK